ncbi:DUF503 domain-containing protein [Anaeroselena agilis]|uniref:DUF503 domain-containing protein n=1 Tax=Anaeroselena agilis TaxID=3063788 RepID=A0ABU3NVW9_9FIRM|nr:DUF503 domain-containing protein [Selenomonadales bacterium 4137-cl]
MAVVVCSVELHIPAAGSLKTKRQAVRSIVGRIRARCGASVAETGHQETWQRAALEVAIVGSSRAVLVRQVELVRRIIDDCGEAEVAAFSVEYL